MTCYVYSAHLPAAAEKRANNQRTGDGAGVEQMGKLHPIPSQPLGGI